MQRVIKTTAMISIAVAVTGCNDQTLTPQEPTLGESKNISVKVDRNGCIAENEKRAPLDYLIRAYESCYQKDFSGNGRYLVESGTNPAPVDFDPQDEPDVTNALEHTGLVSYLLYSDGKVRVDQVSPPNRLGNIFNDETLFMSNSVGKSVTSYLLGHAICEGYIDGVDTTMSDWPLVQGTLYENLKLSDIINMRVGDHKFVEKNRILFDNRWGANNPLHKSIAYWGEELQGTKPSHVKLFNYNEMLPNLTLNYIQYKAGQNFDSLVRSFLQEKVGIENDFQFNRVDSYGRDEDGLLVATFMASRYDYLRLGIALLNDWRSDSCEGRYLKGLYERRGRGNDELGFLRWRINGTKTNYKYAGFFYTDIGRVKGRSFAMAGYGGQLMLVNFDTGVIVSTLAVHDNFLSRKIVVDAANKYGKR